MIGFSEEVVDFLENPIEDDFSKTVVINSILKRKTIGYNEVVSLFIKDLRVNSVARYLVIKFLIDNNINSYDDCIKFYFEDDTISFNLKRSLFEGMSNEQLSHYKGDMDLFMELEKLNNKLN